MRPKRPRIDSPVVRNGRLQPIDNLLSRPLPNQIRVYRKVYGELEMEFLKQKRGSPYSAQFIPVLQDYLDSVSTHWRFMRSQCHTNPDFFEWPSTQAWIGDGAFGASFFEKEGALSLFGYSVAAGASLSKADRWQTLDLVFSAVIPPVSNWSSISEWGEPKSAQRLRKMANCLAAFARNGARRRETGMAKPVEKWVSDLEYLREKYYVGHFGFGWPGTSQT